MGAVPDGLPRGFTSARETHNGALPSVWFCTAAGHWSGLQLPDAPADVERQQLGGVRPVGG